MTSQTSRPEDIYPVTLALIESPTGLDDPLSLPEFLGQYDKGCGDRPWLAELAAIERACRDCGIRPVSGGCLALTHGFGLDIFSVKDPYGFC